MPKEYELVLIAHPELNEEGVSAALEKVTSFITQKGGEVSKVEQWGKKKLAYPIRQCREGNYVLAEFSGDGAWVGELESQILLNESFLRHLLVRKEKVTQVKEEKVNQEVKSNGQPE